MKEHRDSKGKKIHENCFYQHIKTGNLYFIKKKYEVAGQLVAETPDGIIFKIVHSGPFQADEIYSHSLEPTNPQIHLKKAEILKGFIESKLEKLAKPFNQSQQIYKPKT